LIDDGGDTVDAPQAPSDVLPGREETRERRLLYRFNLVAERGE
jgi:hypothetical protein